jgi:hypothetical protein
MVTAPQTICQLASAPVADLAHEPDRLAASECEAPLPRRGGGATARCVSGGASKQLSTLRALLAIHGGHVVHELPEGGFLVCWRGLSRECHDLVELEAHARRVGVLK